MNNVFLVLACVHYEGQRAIRAFGEKSGADDFSEQCTAYQGTRPAWPGDDATEADINAWSKADNEWMAAHPGGDVGSPDYFAVIEVPFGPAALDKAEGRQSIGEGGRDA